MKTEQEQIERMARTMCGYCSTDGKCAVSKNGRETDICANVDDQHCLYKEYADRLIEKGYDDVPEYNAEIERLKAENNELNKKNWLLEEELKKKEFEITYARNNGYEKGYDECEEYMKSKIKQAQIDVLNKAKERCDLVAEELEDEIDHYGSSAAYNCAYEIKKLIEEVQNGEDKG